MGRPHLRGRELCSTSLELSVCVNYLESSTPGYLFDRFSIAKQACGYLFRISMLAFHFYFNNNMLLRMNQFGLWGQFHWPLESLRHSFYHFRFCFWHVLSATVYSWSFCSSCHDLSSVLSPRCSDSF